MTDKKKEQRRYTLDFNKEVYDLGGSPVIDVRPGVVRPTKEEDFATRNASVFLGILLGNSNFMALGKEREWIDCLYKKKPLESLDSIDTGLIFKKVKDLRKEGKIENNTYFVIEDIFTNAGYNTTKEE